MNMKRYISIMLIFASLLASCTATSCGGQTTGNDETSTCGDTTPAEETTAEPDRLDELGEHDFGGKKFTILDANDHPDWHVNMHGDSLNGDIVNDALYERDLAIEDKFNVDIDYVQMTNAKTGTDALKKGVLAGDDEFTMCISTILGGTLGTIVSDGVLANLCDNEYLSLDKSWWSYLFKKNLELDGKMYFTTGDISPTMYQMPHCLYLNTKLAEDYQVDTEALCQLVRDGKWTLDELISRVNGLNQDLNGDGKMEPTEDFFGLAFNTNSSQNNLDSFVVDAGVTLSNITKDGKGLEIDIMNEYTLKILDKVKNLYIDKYKFGDQWEYINSAFKDGRALFMYHMTESAQNFLRDMEDDYMILPMPKGEVAQDDYHSYVNAWADAFVAIPTNADNELAGVVTEALAFWSWKYIRPKSYEMTYKLKTARNDNSAEMLDIVFSTLCLDFNYIYDSGGTFTALRSVIGGDKELASALASKMDKADSEIEKLVTSWINE